MGWEGFPYFTLQTNNIKYGISSLVKISCIWKKKKKDPDVFAYIIIRPTLQFHSFYATVMKQTNWLWAACGSIWYGTKYSKKKKRREKRKGSCMLRNTLNIAHWMHTEKQLHARLSPSLQTWHITRWAATMGRVPTTAGIDTVLRSRLSSALYNIHALLFFNIKAIVTCLSF